MSIRGTSSRGPHSRRPGPSATTLMLLVALTAFSGAGSACRRPPVKTTPMMPPLEVPPPPPRNVEPADTQTPQPMPLVDAPVRTVERPRATPPPQPREARPEPKVEAPAEPKPAEEVRSGATLQTTPSASEGELERKVRAILQTATNDLNRVDYRRLNADVQMQYDTAKGFVRQAEEALAKKNLVFAQTMAEKAATMASQLAGR